MANEVNEKPDQKTAEEVKPGGARPAGPSLFADYTDPATYNAANAQVTTEAEREKLREARVTGFMKMSHNDFVAGVQSFTDRFSKAKDPEEFRQVGQDLDAYMTDYRAARAAMASGQFEGVMQGNKLDQLTWKSGRRGGAFRDVLYNNGMTSEENRQFMTNVLGAVQNGDSYGVKQLLDLEAAHFDVKALESARDNGIRVPDTFNKQARQNAMAMADSPLLPNLTNKELMQDRGGSLLGRLSGDKTTVQFTRIKGGMEALTHPDSVMADRVYGVRSAYQQPQSQSAGRTVGGMRRPDSGYVEPANNKGGIFNRAKNSVDKSWAQHKANKDARQQLLESLNGHDTPDTMSRLSAADHRRMSSSTFKSRMGDLGQSVRKIVMAPISLLRYLNPVNKIKKMLDNRQAAVSGSTVYAEAAAATKDPAMQAHFRGAQERSNERRAKYEALTGFKFPSPEELNKRSGKAAHEIYNHMANNRDSAAWDTVTAHDKYIAGQTWGMTNPVQEAANMARTYGMRDPAKQKEAQMLLQKESEEYRNTLPYIGPGIAMDPKILRDSQRDIQVDAELRRAAQRQQPAADKPAAQPADKPDKPVEQPAVKADRPLPKGAPEGVVVEAEAQKPGKGRELPDVPVDGKTAGAEVEAGK